MDYSKSNAQTILSIGSGSLGIERGIQGAGTQLKVAAYVEIEAFIIANLIAGMEKGLVAPAPVWTDIKTFRPTPFRNKIHGIIAGYPCQPFSHAGLRKGTNDPRHLWLYIERVICSTRPLWCFFENVEGHLSLGFDEVYKSLHRLGYNVEAGLYSAEEVGAPHQRKRLFILALANSGSKGLPGRKEQHHLQFATSERSCSLSKWPANPGSGQYEWEEPRTVEPGLGCAIDGYNFREDLLRMYGNGVVQQTAALAWKDLWKKIRL